MTILNTLAKAVKAALVAATLAIGGAAVAPSDASAKVVTGAYTGGAKIVDVRYGYKRHGWKRHGWKRHGWKHYGWKHHGYHKGYYGYYKPHYRPHYKKYVCVRWYYGRCARWGYVYY